MRNHFTLERMIIVKKLKTTNAGEDIEKRELLHMIGGNDI
jgi:hypothetical protein